MASSSTTVRYRGVSLHRLWGWRAYTARAGKQIHLGWHETAELAAFARDAWIVENCDQFAFVNFPPVLNPLLVNDYPQARPDEWIRTAAELEGKSIIRSR